MRGALFAVALVLTTCTHQAPRPIAQPPPECGSPSPPCECPTCDRPACAECPAPKPCPAVGAVRTQGKAALGSVGIRVVEEGCPSGLVCIGWDGQLELIRRLGACERQR